MNDREAIDGLPFERWFFVDRDELVAARWWQESMSTVADLKFMNVDRRRMLATLGTVVAGYVVVALVVNRVAGDDDDGGAPVTVDALDFQRTHGWNYGASASRLVYAGASGLDASGSRSWSEQLPMLAGLLAPAREGLVPFYVPTLFQVVAAADFRNGLTPIHTAEMDAAYARGDALGKMLAGKAGKPPADTALLVDVSGPEAVALAAGLAPNFDPVFLFDNWPHPRGVVLSHEVVAAAAYHLPSFAAARRVRPAGAPPVFVIDSRRLTPYRDEGDAFDNRYLARLPSADAFRRLGIAHLVYVTERPADHEADDLNDDFVALASAGVDVKMVPLSDFHRSASSPGVAYGSGYYYRVGGFGYAGYRPVPRTTIFTSRLAGVAGVAGKTKPAGFGRVSVQTSSGTGAIRIGRSGSLGRSRSSFGG